MDAGQVAAGREVEPWLLFPPGAGQGGRGRRYSLSVT